MLPFVKPVEVKQYFDDEQFGYDEMIHKIIEKEEKKSFRFLITSDFFKIFLTRKVPLL